MKSLLAVLPECAHLEPQALLQTLTYWAAVDPDTVYAGVRSLPPGCVMAIEADGREHTHRYWDWDFPDAADTSPAASLPAEQDPAGGTQH